MSRSQLDHTTLRGALLALLLLLSPLAASAEPLLVYDDQLRNGFSDWSWAVHTFAQTAVVHSGTTAASFEPDGWTALYFHHDGGISFGEYEALELWLHGGPGGGQALRLSFMSGNTLLKDVSLAGFLPGGVIPANQWIKVRVAFSSLGLSQGAFDGFYLMDNTGGNQAPVYVDDVQITEQTGPVDVLVGAVTHRISPLIYGVNFGSSSQAARLRWPVRRWGGNATTRYSWEDDASNRAQDWFFFNVPENNPNPSTLPHGSAADRFIDETRAYGGQVLLTLPTIGWTPIDRNRRWSFSVAKYGDQQKTECTESGWASWCQPDAGNGVHLDGTLVTGNDPYDTSREVGPDFVTRWMGHIASRVGTASQGGVKFFALDNEPMLWDSTHRDVHPAPVTYDELWQRTLDYAAAIKAQDPNAQLFGPVTWGWCDLFSSAQDHPGDCTSGPDRTAHNNVPFLEWYLQKVRDHELATGVRLVDWVDLHFYPEGPGIVNATAETPDLAARRLRSLKSLYDPSYSDESWIGQPIYLIPRVKQWIQNKLPGAKLAITEYNFGRDDQLSSALAQAEALAIFGREGVDLATRWVAPAENSLVEDAFRLYLSYNSYNGTGYNLLSGSSTATTSSNVNAVGAYAIHGTGYAGNNKQVAVLLFNKGTSSRRVNTRFSSGTPYAYPGYAPPIYHFSGTQRLTNLPGSALSFQWISGGFSVDLPARSATLVLVDVAYPRS